MLSQFVFFRMILQFDFRCNTFYFSSMCNLIFTLQLVCYYFWMGDRTKVNLWKNKPNFYVIIPTMYYIFKTMSIYYVHFACWVLLGHFGIQSVKYFDISSMSTFIFETQGGISALYPSSGIIWELDQPFRPLLHGYSLPILFFIIHLSF